MPEGVLKSRKRTAPQRGVLSDSSPFAGMTPTGQLKLYLQAKQKYGEASPEVARGNLQTALEWAPGTGDVVAAKDAWDFSGDAADALIEGDFSGALGNYGKMALALAGVLPFVPNLVRSADPQRTASIFAGIGAKTADKDALARAQEMETEGVDPSRIWSETGWGRGADGEWRFEIDDSGARVADPLPAQGAVEDVVDHPDLIAAYPDIGRTDFAGESYGRKMQGSWSGNPVDADDVAMFSLSPRARDKRSTSLHELQHGVQNVEGFGKGGNTLGLSPGTPAWDLYQKRVEAILTPKPFDDFASEAGFDDFGQARQAYEEYVQNIETMRRKGLPQHLDRAAQESAMSDAYRLSAGEVEARNVQTRRDYTPEQRRASPPWETEDVPRDQQIVRRR